MIRLPFLVAAAAACAAVAPLRAEAQQVLVQNAAGACKSALPVFDGNLRNRPTAVANEGSSGAFVSCSMEDTIGGKSTFPSILLHNNGASSITVTCTLVQGSAGGARYYTKSRTYSARSGGYILWSEVDNSFPYYLELINFSCNLPPGVEIRLVSRTPA